MSTDVGTTSVVTNPFDLAVVGEVPLLAPADVDAAVARGRAALREVYPAHARAAVLDRVARVLEERLEQFARTIALESAKPISTARGEVLRAVSTFQFSAVVARTHAGQVLPLDASPFGEGKLGFTVRTPIGVVGAITPFNFPLNLVAHKVGPAIAVGCPIIVKPAAATPLTAVLLHALVLECGLPADRFQIVTGPGSSVGARLVEHPGVDMITFTGSPEVGWALRARAARKRVGLELGNNAPLIIAADGDASAAALAVRTAGFAHAGQSCISTQRLLVHRSHYDAFVEELVAQVETLKVGDPLDPDVDVSALIDTGERDRVHDWIEQAQADGARLVTGGQVTGTLLTPTVLADVTPHMRVSADEVFGPVVAVAPFDDIQEAVTLANDSRYGLQAAVWTASISTALQVAHDLDFGGVLINEVPTWRADQQPYGGKRDSGNTREGPAWTAEEMTETKTIIMNGWA